MLEIIQQYMAKDYVTVFGLVALWLVSTIIVGVLAIIIVPNTKTPLPSWNQKAKTYSGYTQVPLR